MIALFLKSDPKVRQERGIVAVPQPGPELGDGLINPADRAQSDSERIANLSIAVPGLDATGQDHNRIAVLPRAHSSNAAAFLLRLLKHIHFVIIGKPDADPASAQIELIEVNRAVMMCAADRPGANDLRCFPAGEMRGIKLGTHVAEKDPITRIEPKRLRDSLVR